ncbi:MULTISPECIES: TRAP transporter large permease [Marinobacter]|jgi:tripartite ATP-independent transporter DctM subunit|uniref:TRAP transporter large permease protein n=3 Tax=Marinobacter TaxID=2742 RepID=A0A137SGA7_9GAMM|nr:MULTISPECIES: TRAP transporter large permease subunit [Marinobacter]PKM03636.1 MAG: C4-dicarboxylate ABC transporter [Gammaproteobacteria bacterium HGW-Gammaproteobacteria-6]WBU41404.1 TRAP transporter large permease subunit [Marinobacter alkaliphilus]KXO10810.1 TRAP dicarboxylate transporter, DctM subunit, unknown substrate 6 [Marinobacter excellens LAMA 842]KXO11475.1 TRAP dicarboxylate transporter, DctM subunit, unknown substrate 6 [Marinobacter excellens LAMA 842]MCD1629232.1 TRAP trans
MGLETLLVIAMFAAFMVLLLLGFPVAWSLAGIGLVFAVLANFLIEHFDADLWFTWNGTIGVLDARLYGVVANELMVALPLFIFMGIMLDRSGIAEKLMHSLVRVLGPLRGGYAITVVIVGVLLAASTGIVGASVVLLGMLSLGPMMQAQYNKSLAVGTACSVGTLGILVPPSIMLVLMADRLGTSDASVGKLFMGALIPGLMLGAMYILYILIASFIKKDLAPAPKNREPLDLRALLDVFLAVVPPMALIIAVLGSIFFGIATTTEASAVGAFGALLMALLSRRLNVKVLRESLYQTSRTTAFIFGIFIGATVFAAVLRGLGGDDVIRDAITGLPFGTTGILITVLFITFLLGFFLDWVEITLIILPLVAPVVFSLGVEPVWFAVMFAICLQTSFLTPPVGFSLFYIKGVCPPGITTRHIYLGVLPFIALQVLGLALVFWFEPLATWLPNEVYGGR